MLTRLLCVFLAAAVAVTSLPPPAEAQFGIRRAMKRVIKAPARVLTAPLRVVPGVVGGPFRAAFGVVAAVAVGAVIFNLLPKHERREVARRSKVVVAKDPDQRVEDVYTSKDGRRQVTIVAEPMQTAAEMQKDPAILVVADTVVAPDGKAGPNAAPAPGGAALASDKPAPSTPPQLPGQAKAPAPAAKPVVDEEMVRISEVPPDTQCRKVTTALEIRKKKGQETADQKDSNTAIFCQTAPGEWKPASA